MERVAGIEPASRPWQGRIIATIRYPLVQLTINNFRSLKLHVMCYVLHALTADRLTNRCKLGKSHAPKLTLSDIFCIL